MKICKFGGASIKNAEGVRNLSKIVQDQGRLPLITIVSAMGKTTNALEELTSLAFRNQDFNEQLNSFKSFHSHIVNELFAEKSHIVYADVDRVYEQVNELLTNENYKLNYGLYYDQVVSQGEILSSIIVNHYLNFSGIKSVWLDAREVIKTDETFREGKVDWDLTEKMIKEGVEPFRSQSVILSQGFIGSSLTNLTTTLGREGSDFSAAIFATCLNAENVTIWKDVPGILNADPKLIQATVKFDELSYNEAAEMTYYGAQVIHPKTIKPLANKGIPLWVKSFERPLEKGTIIHGFESRNLPPTIVFKFNQHLVSFHVKDLTFIDENNLSAIFHQLDRLNIKINLMQNSAVSFSICVDYNEQKIDELFKALQYVFDVRYNENLTLITIKNYDQKTIDELSEGKNVLLEQRTRHTYQIVVK